ncbi:putative uncharacterized protein DDB_G0282133 isoform X1 [Colias croceus]|uniref:putative uncharacterized protein DDB_G0282133 isoform X1 n=1 Tax=Colias crocea TaxID=72248 RepID=UPI001E27C024|nr:putative uncharacterized protein DDB_G0282133 isoform X1 [Colias croceus]XP_045508996.1 putative uncharacterized protein DDB_G0282133 isoform X1 [Colias croceus]
MLSGRDEGPVYYREIQKNAYLKRIPEDYSGKLRPLVHKKPPLKPMWTLLCVHNGKTPYLEQYPTQDSPTTHAHKPAWRVCLKGARHVTASVKPHTGQEYDFLVDTESGPVRMVAPDWDAMQDWVSTLRTKLHELRIIPRGENVYGAPPAAAVPRAAARDPTSPLPPTPPVPVDRVPGIELGPNIRPITTQNSIESTEHKTTTTVNTSTHTNTQNVNSTHAVTSTLNDTRSTTVTLNDTTVTSLSNVRNVTTTSVDSTSLQTVNVKALTTLASVRNLLNVNTTNVNSPLNDINVNTSLTNVRNALNSIVTSEVDISNWDAPISLPSTSRDKIEPKSVAKICGQSVCLDDSILKRTVSTSDDEFFTEMDKISDSVDNLDDFAYTQRLNVTDAEVKEEESTPQRTNITVIQVSNKGPPHTAIPVLGPETDIFDFNFKQKLSIKPNQPDFVNIVNTEQNSEYGTVFDKPDSEYGHISLTTTVSVTGRDDKSDASVNVKSDAVNVKSDASVHVKSDGVYERLCMASTSNASPLSVRRLRNEKIRKSSLPNLELESTYECLFPSQDNRRVNGEANSNVNSNVSNSIVPNSNVSNSNVPNSNVSNSNVQNSNVSNTNTNVANLNSNVSRTNVESNDRLRNNVERSHSQNAYDNGPRLRERRVQNNSPKREKNDKPTTNMQQKPIWRRGLTELSLLTRLKSIGLKRAESPTRQECDIERNVTSPTKVVHRSRTGARVDSSRRRSNSLSNGQPAQSAVSLRVRQALSLRAEQARGACCVGAVPARDPPLLADCDGAVWIARWNSGGNRCGGRSGDRVAAVAGVQPTCASHARQIVKGANKHMVDVLFHRVPLGKIFVITKKDHELLGIKLDSECTIQSVDTNGPAYRAGLPPGKWAVTEVNNRPINLIKGGEEEMNRISARGTEVSILIQPTSLVKKLRAAIKGNRPLLALR